MINLNEPYDVYVATEVGDVSHGGVSVWVDYWLQNIAPYLVTKPVLLIEVEQKEEWDIKIYHLIRSIKSCISKTAYVLLRFLLNINTGFPF